MAQDTDNNDLPTTSEMAELGANIATDGFALHEATIADLAQTARRADLQPIAIAVLADRSEPEVVRARAFSRIAAAWDSYRAVISQGVEDDRPLHRLLDAWNAHEDLRSAGTALDNLAASRTRLDQVRRETALLQRCGCSV